MLFESLVSRGIVSSGNDFHTCQQGIKDLGWTLALGNFLQSEEMDESKFDTINARLFRTLYHEKSSIPTSLRLAYYCLPAHLKQCFAYCAMFHSCCLYEKNTLVWLWMAEGFIELKTGMTVEEVGDSYFEELLEKSFFEPHHRIGPCGKADLFLVPEHAYHLAELVSGTKYCRLDLQKSYVLLNSSGVSDQFNVEHLYFTVENFSRRNLLGARHLSFWNPLFGLGVVGDMVRPKGLHSLLIRDGFSASYFTGVPYLCQKLRWLRTLNLSYTSIIYLPDSIGELQNLRYLDLSGNEISSLPDSFTKLYNLQTLRARDLKRSLVFPIEVWKLVNLRHLGFGEDVKFSMPRGLGRLVSLHTLSGFVVPKSSEAMIREQKDLRNLQTLVIKNLDSVLHMDEAKEANLWDKQYLYKLQLQWGYLLDSKIVEDVLAAMTPYTNIYSLEILGYYGSQFASWVGDQSYSKLETIHLCCCPNCKTLPLLGNLPSLKHLYIHHMSSVRVINKEFYGANTGKGFLSLVTLKVVYLNSLEEWTGLEEGDMPCLSQLRIEKCFNLNALPSLKFMRSLCFLDIISCPELQYLQIERLPSSVESLTICNCPILSKRCKSQVGEDWHKISQIPKLAIDGM